MTHEYWNPRTERMPRQELEKLQLAKLQRLVAWTYHNSGLWRKKMDAAGIAPGDVQGLADIGRIPFLTREELNQCQLAQPPFGDVMTVSPARAVRYHQTSGTSGRTPLRILDGWKDWEWVSEMWCYGMYGFGVREDDIVYVAYAYGTFIGFWGAHYASEKIGAMTVPGGGLSSEDRIRKMIDLGVTVLVCTPTYAIRLAQVAAGMGINLADQSRVRRLIHAGEPGACIPATKKMLEKAWGARVGDFPGMSETGGSIAYECSAQSGGIHILEDHYIQEVVDPSSGNPLGYGETGELVLTSFGRTALPLIRYRTGDLVKRRESTFCSCGRTFDLYEGGYLGRADDMKIVRGVNIFPSAIENIIREFDGIVEFQIVISSDKGNDQVLVKIEPAPGVAASDYSAMEKQIARRLYVSHALSFQVQAVDPNSLPRFELKARRLQDLRSRS
ncbi:MAG: AMP-binding protein [Peptococcaceae bacterium]|jgi:phenylacetate-CoA ligase|nr:AMP-binding protein [Peptococcaceae bacterium]